MASVSVLEGKQFPRIADTVFHIIVNPVSGAGQAQQFMDGSLKPLLESVNAQFDVFTTKNSGDAPNIARKLKFDDNKRNIVVIIGGDGSLNEFVHGLAAPFPNLEFALAPLGTANALFHSMAVLEETDPLYHVGAILAAVQGDNSKLKPLQTAIVKAGGQSYRSLVVASTALHASILYEADQMRHVQGVERFKQAAAKHWGTEYHGTLAMSGSVRKYSPAKKVFVDASQTNEKGPWAYLTGCLIDRLEMKFVVAPLRTTFPEDGTIDIVAARRPIHIDAETFSQGLQVAFGQMYNEGKHVDLVWEEADGKYTAQTWREGLRETPVIEIWRAQQFEWVPVAFPVLY